MKNGNSYSLVEVSILIIFLSILLGIFTNIKLNSENNKIRKFIKEINSYNVSIKNFKRKYGFLPGDITKTNIFQLSKNNTDGNQNGLIEDKNQKNEIIDKNIKIDGEIANFWLHLYNSNFINQKDNKNIFPYSNFLNSGILVFSSSNKNYYHLGIFGINENKELETYNNLTPNQAYIIDKKLDDGLPLSGNITIFTENKIKHNMFNKENQRCGIYTEYLTNNKSKLCQLVIEL